MNAEIPHSIDWYKVASRPARGLPGRGKEREKVTLLAGARPLEC